ncbi:FAD-dependent oxidoreductase [Candidatus Micrarchaeota archaeon]|nr:FAD-dependent oxidoreductase [Candidatus Micrarchaeota archaeon]
MPGSVVVLGAGVTGLSAGWKLAESGLAVDVLEKRDHIGGTATTFQRGPYQLDLGPHKIYTQLPNVMKEIQGLLGEELQTIPKKSRIRILEKYFSYPFKPTALMSGVSPAVAFGFGMSYASMLAKRTISKEEDYSYEKYLTNRFGRKIYEAVFQGYAEKVWGVNPNGLDAELARIRVSIPSLTELIKRMFLGNKNKKEITASEFYYPKHGCIQLSNRMAQRITDNGGRIHLKTLPTEIRMDGHRVDTVIFEERGLRKPLTPSYLISSIHLGDVVKLFRPLPPEKVLQAASKLRYRALILVYLVVKKSRLFDDNWIFYPERDIVFNRISEQKGFSGLMVPEDKTVLCVEITCSDGDAQWNASDHALYGQVVADLEKVEILKRDEVAESFTVRLRNKYPLYDVGFSVHLNEVVKYLDSLDNFLTIGRQGLFNYNNMDHCLDMGFLASDHIVQSRTKEEWTESKKRFSQYQIVD